MAKFRIQPKIGPNRGKMAAAAAPVAGAIAGVSPDERARYVRWRGLVSLGSERLGKPRDVANPFVPITHAACVKGSRSRLI